jgi:hypothetical protein
MWHLAVKCESRLSTRMSGPPCLHSFRGFPLAKTRSEHRASHRTRTRLAHRTTDHLRDPDDHPRSRLDTVVLARAHPPLHQRATRRRRRRHSPPQTRATSRRVRRMRPTRPDPGIENIRCHRDRRLDRDLDDPRRMANGDQRRLTSWWHHVRQRMLAPFPSTLWGLKPQARRRTDVI